MSGKPRPAKEFINPEDISRILEELPDDEMSSIESSDEDCEDEILDLYDVQNDEGPDYVAEQPSSDSEEEEAVYMDVEDAEEEIEGLIKAAEQTQTMTEQTMTIKRFEFLVRCLRFDDKEHRDRNQKLAPISELWELFLSECRKHYRPGSYVTIDEQLVAFRGKCPFRMYLPNKPAKYGMKKIIICDSGTKYMIDAIAYTGKGTASTQGPSASQFVHKLVESIKHSNRNVTFDNWFTSIPLIQELSQKGLTSIGTLKKNKKELPPAFTDPKFKNRKVGSSLFLYDETMTAVSYKPKNNKVVTLLSSMHSRPELHPYSQKPFIIHAYNATKGGVDTLDQLCSLASCNRRTKRWPLSFFYNIINIACINSYVIYKHNFFRNQHLHKDHASFVSEQHASGQEKLGASSKRKASLGLSDNSDNAPKRSRRVLNIKQSEKKPLTRQEFLIKLSEQLTYSCKKMRLEQKNAEKLNNNLKFWIKEKLKVSSKTLAPMDLTENSTMPQGNEVPAPDWTNPIPSTSTVHASNGRNPASSASEDKDLNIEDRAENGANSRKLAKKRQYCSFCPSHLKRKTSTSCGNCSRLICGSHIVKKLCTDCSTI